MTINLEIDKNIYFCKDEQSKILLLHLINFTMFPEEKLKEVLLLAQLHDINVVSENEDGNKTHYCQGFF